MQSLLFVSTPCFSSVISIVYFEEKSLVWSIMTSHLKAQQKTGHKNDTGYVDGYWNKELSWNPCSTSAGLDCDEKVKWRKNCSPLSFEILNTFLSGSFSLPTQSVYGRLIYDTKGVFIIFNLGEYFAVGILIPLGLREAAKLKLICSTSYLPSMMAMGPATTAPVRPPRG